jgi:hypothetical protein
MTASGAELPTQVQGNERFPDRTLRPAIHSGYPRSYRRDFRHRAHNVAELQTRGIRHPVFRVGADSEIGAPIARARVISGVRWPTSRWPRGAPITAPQPTRREQLSALWAAFGFSMLAPEHKRELLAWLLPVALGNTDAMVICTGIDGQAVAPKNHRSGCFRHRASGRGGSGRASSCARARYSSTRLIDEAVTLFDRVMGRMFRPRKSASARP